MAETSIVYLLHFDRPMSHAQHYLGSTADLVARLQQHRNGTGANITRVAVERGIKLQLARTWLGGRDFERQLKKQGGASRRCPICWKAKYGGSISTVFTSVGGCTET